MGDVAVAGHMTCDLLNLVLVRKFPSAGIENLKTTGVRVLRIENPHDPVSWQLRFQGGLSHGDGNGRFSFPGQS